MYELWRATGGHDAHRGDVGPRPGRQGHGETFLARRRRGQLYRTLAVPLALGQVTSQERRAGLQRVRPGRRRRVCLLELTGSGFQQGTDPFLPSRRGISSGAALSLSAAERYTLSPENILDSGVEPGNRHPVRSDRRDNARNYGIYRDGRIRGIE